MRRTEHGAEMRRHLRQGGWLRGRTQGESRGGGRKGGPLGALDGHGMAKHGGISEMVKKSNRYIYYIYIYIDNMYNMCIYTDNMYI